MTPTILIPVRPFREGKTRLAGNLDQPARAALVERMLRHVLETAVSFLDGRHCRVISRGAEARSIAEHFGAIFVAESGHGLNAALEQGAAGCEADQPVLAISADLPLLTAQDLAAMMEQLDSADVVAAADHNGVGTNALLLRKPGLVRYAFGPDSLMKHRRAAEANAMRFAVCRRHGLATDIDLPADLKHLELLQGPFPSSIG